METQNAASLTQSFETEDYISLAAAAALIRIDGKRARPSTVFRWYQNGIGGRHGGPRVHLKALRLGGRIVTKTSWVREFLDQVAAAATGIPPSPLTAALPKLISNRNREGLARDKREAEQKAAAVGF